MIIPVGATGAWSTAASAGFDFTSLYNGNIASMSVNIAQAGKPLLYNYRYDQLNRLKSMNVFEGLNAQTHSWEPLFLQDYGEKITYDPNGNILSYNRHGDAARVSMDSLLYSYKVNSNQLDRVAERAADAAVGVYDQYNDIRKGQAAGNYQYDAIGNLIKDVSEGITGIEWTVYGKIKSITKGGSTIQYTYDAAGNRISKSAGGKTTFYVRDASGNVMSVYEQEGICN